MSRRVAKAATDAEADDDAADADANEEAVEVESSDDDEDIATAKPAAKKGSKRADHVEELLGQLQNTYENYTIAGSDINTSKNIALLRMVQKLSLNELAAPNNSQLTDRYLNEIEKTAFALDQFSVAMRKLSHASNKTSPSRLALYKDMLEFVKANQARMQGLVDKKRKSTPKVASSASKKKAKKSEVQIATDHSISKLERQISVLESELAPGSQIKRLIDQAENALSRADGDIQNAKDEVKSTLDSFTKKNPMPDEIDDEDAYAAWSKQKTKVLAPKKTKLKLCKDAKSSAEQTLADNTKLLENKQSDLAALQIQLQNIEWLSLSYTKPSSIHGTGLFARKTIPTNTCIGRYDGRTLAIVPKECDAKNHPAVLQSTSPNLLIIKANVGWRVVDGSFSLMRFINDCRGTGSKANTIYKQNGDVYTTRRVFADEEFLIKYGKYYWGLD